jgi:hypothetical protein
MVKVSKNRQYKKIKAKKGKEFPVHDSVIYRGNRGTASVVLHLGGRWRSIISFTPRPLYPWKSALVPIE